MVASWLLALALLGYLFRVIPAHKLWAALQNVSLPAFLAVVVCYVLGVLATDTAATLATFRRSLPQARVDYLEVLRIRGATYLLALVNYALGQGGIAYFLTRRHNVPAAAAAGAVVLTAGVNLILVAACAGIGLLVGGAPSSPALRLVVLALSLGFPAYLAVIATRPGFLARTNLLRPLFDAGLGGHLRIAAARIPHIAALLVGNLFAMRLFGVNPPVWQAVALLPIVFVVAILPISPMGLGTSQATAVGLFAPFAIGTTPDDQQAAVMAYSLSLQFVGLLLQALVGLIFLPGLLREERRRVAGPTAP